MTDKKETYAYLRENLVGVRKRIEDAKAAAKREDEVLLVAAVKYASAGEIEELVECGVFDMGENRVNTFLEHKENVPDERIRWHFIGSLQKNKVKYIVGKIALLHSLDSVSLAEEIEKRYAKEDLILDCLVEINIGREESKGGVYPENVSEFFAKLRGFSHVNPKGFMTMAPAGSTKEEFLRYFSEAKRIGDRIWKEQGLPEKPLYSIGMSRSLFEAVASGSNMVRIGSDLFGHK